MPYTVNLNEAHTMTINPEEECGQSRHIDDAEPVGLSRYER